MKKVSHPTFGNGKVCYLEIPAIEVQDSATFFQKVFGWSIRDDKDGDFSFDDGIGEVSGTWVPDRPPSQTPGILVSIMVTDVIATLQSVIEHGGGIAEPPSYLGTSQVIARFFDPAGNIFCLYQHNKK